MAGAAAAHPNRSAARGSSTAAMQNVSVLKSPSPYAVIEMLVNVKPGAPSNCGPASRLLMPN